MWALLVFLIWHLLYLFLDIPGFSTKYFFHSSKYIRVHMANFYCSVYFILWFLLFEANVFQQFVLLGRACLGRCRITWLWKKGLWAVVRPELWCKLPAFCCWLDLTIESCLRATAPDPSCSCRHTFSAMTTVPSSSCLPSVASFVYLYYIKGGKSYSVIFLLYFMF